MIIKYPFLIKLSKCDCSGEVPMLISALEFKFAIIGDRKQFYRIFGRIVTIFFRFYIKLLQNVLFLRVRKYICNYLIYEYINHNI